MKSRGRYLRDASHFRGSAERIFLPSTEQEAAQILRKAAAQRTPVTLSGGGTGLTGARVPRGGWVLSTERMSRKVQIHWDPRRQRGGVVVGPAVTLKKLEEALDKQGLFYPPNPGERKAFLGGTVATNASGSRSFKYGPTRRYVQRLRVVLATGEILECHRGKVRAKGKVLTTALSSGRRLIIPVPSYALPKVKNAAGYYAASGMDLVDLFVGSEGTLGLFTEIELEVFRKPDSLLEGIFFFPSDWVAFAFAWKVKRLAKTKKASLIAPRALEFFDSRSLALLARKGRRLPPGAAIFFEQELSARPEEAVRLAWIRLAQRCGARLKVSRISCQPKDHRTFGKLRHDLPVLVNQRAARNGFRKIGTDLAVPDGAAREMFGFTLEKLPKSRIPFAIFGHIGDNNLHVNLLPTTSREFSNALELYDLLAKKAIQLKGTISAEHGVGKLRVPYLERMVGREGLKQMAKVKKALDPNGILSPGNVIPVEMLFSS